MSRMQVPGYWRNETSGVLAEVVRVYLSGSVMTPREIAVMRTYFVQWLSGDGWRGEGVVVLRKLAERIQTREDIHAWLEAAVEEGVDPL